MYKKMILLFVIVLLISGLVLEVNRHRDNSNLTRLSANGKTIFVEIAETKESQKLGLSGRASLAENHGMLFVQKKITFFCMWAKDVLIPISVAFLNQDGIITHVEEMQPKTGQRHCPIELSKFALEMNGHWFERNGIGIGSRIDGIPAKLLNNSR